jgi:hypothetical protein
MKLKKLIKGETWYNRLLKKVYKQRLEYFLANPISAADQYWSR